jgi:pimeloyl-ACP methyl ester carboxylesterase
MVRRSLLLLLLLLLLVYFKSLTFVEMCRVDERVARLTAAAAITPSDVMLVHGYCASYNPFESSGHSWNQAKVFGDYKQNLPTDEFARRVATFGESKGLSQFAVIGHSQGGLVGVHLLSSYWSGLDVSRVRGVRSNVTAMASGNGRLVQSVGSPYSGCSGAGTGANLIALFGVACGANSDLTPEGAALWLATVSEAASSNLYRYQTISATTKGWTTNWCNFATYMVLDAPNDGTTELSRTTLGALPSNDMGNTLKQCHTTEMSYMVQTDDVTRNAEMDAAAL